MKPLLAPCIRPKPIIQNRKEPTMKSTKFFMRMFAVFLERVKPASTRAKPGCIKNTSIAAINTQTVSSPLMLLSLTVVIMSSIIQ